MTTRIETKERPILMAGNMVRAILDGRKTETRRVVQPQPPKEISDKIDYWIDTGFLYGFGKIAKGTDGSQIWPYSPGLSCKSIRNPYGNVGDRLWVRETWAASTKAPQIQVAYRADGQCVGCSNDPDWLKVHHGWIHGVATETEGRFVGRGLYGPWKPSIHMPRWASRITLEITDLRIDRLQLITESAAKAEGVKPLLPVADQRWRDAFHLLWDSINEKRGYGWDFNPWVWVVQFKRVLSQVS